MRQTKRALAGATTIATSWWTAISRAALAPIDVLVDWIEADCGMGPVGSP